MPCHEHRQLAADDGARTLRHLEHFRCHCRVQPTAAGLAAAAYLAAGPHPDLQPQDSERVETSLRLQTTDVTPSFCIGNALTCI